MIGTMIAISLVIVAGIVLFVRIRARLRGEVSTCGGHCAECPSCASCAAHRPTADVAGDEEVCDV